MLDMWDSYPCFNAKLLTCSKVETGIPPIFSSGVRGPMILAPKIGPIDDDTIFDFEGSSDQDDNDIFS